MLSLASLSYHDVEFFRAASTCLASLADDLAPKQVAEGLMALAIVGTSQLPQSSLARLKLRCMAVARFCAPEEALHILRALCVLGEFSSDLVLQLVRQVSEIPRSSLSEAEDKGLHQVALSLIYEPAAGPALAAIQALPELWESLYQPDEVAREVEIEAALADDTGASVLLAELAAVRGWTVTSNTSVEGFYSAALLLEQPHCNAVVDVDSDTQEWLLTPADIWRQLKHRHLSLLGFKVVWVKRAEWLALDAPLQREVADRWLGAFVLG